MLIYNDRIWDFYWYNILIAFDIMAIMIDNRYNINLSNWNIFLRLHDKALQRILKFYPSYNALHYILLFPKGDDSWHANIPLIGLVKRKRIITMQFYSYRLQIWDSNWLQYAGHLYQ